LEVKLLKSQIQTNLATNLFVATKAILIWDTLTPDPHQIINTILAWYAAPLLASFDLTVDNFLRKLYCTTHSITTLPPPIAGSIAAPVGHDAAPIPSPVFQAFIQIYRVIDNIFLCPWTAYVKNALPSPLLSVLSESNTLNQLRPTTLPCSSTVNLPLSLLSYLLSSTPKFSVRLPPSKRNCLLFEP
jgi:hypothetical protein